MIFVKLNVFSKIHRLCRLNHIWTPSSKWIYNAELRPHSHVTCVRPKLFAKRTKSMSDESLCSKSFAAASARKEREWPHVKGKGQRVEGRGKGERRRSTRMGRGQEKLSAPCLHRLAKHCSAAELSLYKNVNNNNNNKTTTTDDDDDATWKWKFISKLWFLPRRGSIP